MAKVKIFTTPSCTYCNQAKDFFKENNVEFEAIDVTQDKAAAEEMLDSRWAKQPPGRANRLADIVREHG